MLIALVAVGAAYIRVLNGWQEAARARAGKAAKVLDLSMEGQRRLAARGETVNDVKLAGGVGEKAFDDVTDRMNEDFVYVY